MVVTVAVALFLAFVLWRAYSTQRGLVSVRAAEVQARQERGERLTIVDVRSKYEFDQGHIKGARLISLQSLPAGANGLPKDAEIILVCRSGNRSARAFQLLKAQGYTNLLNMSGGMLAWNGKTER